MRIKENQKKIIYELECEMNNLKKIPEFHNVK